MAHISENYDFDLDSPPNTPFIAAPRSDHSSFSADLMALTEHQPETNFAIELKKKTISEDFEDAKAEHENGFTDLQQKKNLQLEKFLYSAVPNQRFAGGTDVVHSANEPLPETRGADEIKKINGSSPVAETNAVEETNDPNIKTTDRRERTQQHKPKQQELDRLSTEEENVVGSKACVQPEDSGFIEGSSVSHMVSSNTSYAMKEGPEKFDIESLETDSKSGCTGGGFSNELVGDIREVKFADEQRVVIRSKMDAKCDKGKQDKSDVNEHVVSLESTVISEGSPAEINNLDEINPPKGSDNQLSQCSIQEKVQDHNSNQQLAQNMKNECRNDPEMSDQSTVLQQRNFQDVFHSECTGDDLDVKLADKYVKSIATEEKIEDTTRLQHGDHITVVEEKTIYRHHAIVKKVESICAQQVQLRLIHFTTGDGGITLQETSEVYDIDKNDIRVIRYKSPIYSPDEIVKNAENHLDDFKKEKFQSYCVVTNNCEHFATLCAVGVAYSTQIQNLFLFLFLFIIFLCFIFCFPD